MIVGGDVKGGIGGCDIDVSGGGNGEESGSGSKLYMGVPTEGVSGCEVCGWSWSW